MTSLWWLRGAAALGVGMAGVAMGHGFDDALPLLQPEAAPAAGSAAESPSVLDSRVDPDWTLQVEPSFWYVSPSGKLKLPVSSGSGPGSFTTAGDSVKLERLNLDTPRFEPAGEIHLAAERWRFTFSGSTYSIDRNDTRADSSFRLGSVAVSAGDRLDIEMDLTSVEVVGGYRFWGRDYGDPARNDRPENVIDAIVRVYGLVGGRFYDVSFDVARTSGPAGRAEADEFFGEPIVGVRVDVDLAKDFTLDLQVTGGGLPAGDTSSYSVDIQAGFQWRPHPNLGIQIGYRQLAYWLSDGEDAEEFEYNGRLAGLFAGVVLRF